MNTAAHHEFSGTGFSPDLGMSTIRIIGVDCATRDNHVGLALGELKNKVGRLLTVDGGDPVEIISRWCDEGSPSLIALDAPLGWPSALADGLTRHHAGQPLGDCADELFHRATDREIEERLRKRPLEVGASFIARTALAALVLLQEVSERINRPIPLSWGGRLRSEVEAIEVYPAATLLAHGIAPSDYKKPKQHAGRRRIVGALNELLQIGDCMERLEASPDTLDAAICLIAGADYLSGRAVGPRDEQLAFREGWIWAAAGESTG